VSAPEEMPSLEIPDEVLAAVPEYEGNEEAVVIVDFQGLVLGLNERAEELFKMESSDIAGEFVEMLVPQKKRWGHQAYRRGYLAEPNDREMDPGLYPEAETADGEIVPIKGRLQPVRVDGKLFVAAHLVPDTDPRPDDV
jgi:PAS domain S-box-containing protein